MHECQIFGRKLQMLHGNKHEIRLEAESQFAAARPHGSWVLGNFSAPVEYSDRPVCIDRVSKEDIGARSFIAWTNIAIGG
jgi:hypothetical protein